MKDFTKAFHVTDAYIINGEGTKVKTRFTILSKMDKDKVKYKVSFCAPSEPQFKKKDGVANAMNAPEWSFPIENVGDDHNHATITDAILLDMLHNHVDEMPSNHRRWITNDNFGSDIREYYEQQELLELMLQDMLTLAEE